MEIIVDDPESFNCDFLVVNGNSIKYGESGFEKNITIVDDDITLSEKVCDNNGGKINISIPLIIL